MNSSPSLPGGCAGLPTIEGRYQFNVLLKDLTWFKVGGKAQVLFKPRNEEDLRYFLQKCPSTCPLFTLGAGSNVIVREGGWPGVVIKLGKEFGQIHVGDDDTVIAGGAALDRTVSFIAAQQGIGGFGFLVGIPGTIGGAVRMNAGAYGSEIKDVLLSARVMDTKGDVHTLTCADLRFGYRRSDLPEGWIVLQAILQGKPRLTSELVEEMQGILAQREATQPVSGRTGGSTFKNPEGLSAWRLIDAAGCRGLRVGDAEISPKHCNFMINTHQASAADLEVLGERVRQRVFEHSGVVLEWEVLRIGEE